jgi:hypothetical protein
VQHENLDQHEDDVKGPSDRSFGLTFAAVFGLIGLWPLHAKNMPRLWAVGMAVIFLVVSFVRPTVLALPNRLWFKFGNLLHAVVSPIALGVLFYGVFTPMGLFMRYVLRKKFLATAYDRDAKSYWIPRATSSPKPESLKNQF